MRVAKQQAYSIIFDILCSPMVSSLVIIGFYFIFSYWYATAIIMNIYLLGMGEAILASFPIPLLIAVLSTFPMIAYALFYYARGSEQAEQKTNDELRHYNMQTPSLDDEIRRNTRMTYDTRNYRIAIPLATFTVASGWFLFFFWGGPNVVAAVYDRGAVSTLVMNPYSYHPVVFGFLGAVFWSIGTLFHRYLRGDLKSTVFIFITVRFWTVVLLIVVLTAIWYGYEEYELPAELLGISFLIGIFPNIGLDLIKRIAVGSGSLIRVISRQRFPLDKIEGLNLWDQGRLTEEGIDNVQKLAESDVFGLIVNTRLSIMALLHWIDQALLIMHVGDDLETLKKIGIVTASDFEAIYVVQLPNKDKKDIEDYLNQDSCLLCSYMGREGVSKVPEPPSSLMNALKGGEDLKGRVHSIMSAICDDVNYQRLWQIRHGRLSLGYSES